MSTLKTHAGAPSRQANAQSTTAHAGAFSVRQLVGAFGAEIDGIDLSAPLATETITALRATWLDHGFLVFRDQSLSASQQAAFCANFGQLDTYPFVQATTEHPNVIPIIKEPEQTVNFGGGWHTDTSYLACPPIATALFAVEVPCRGGDTLFADSARAFASLSDGFQNLLRGLTGVFTPALVHGRSGAYAQVQHGMAKKVNEQVAEQRVEHPVVRTHEETGKPAIYAGPAHCERFTGMSREESAPLLKQLIQIVTQAEYTTRLRWTKGTFVIWDNRRTFHYALNDYQGERRQVHRVTIKGPQPR